MLRRSSPALTSVFSQRTQELTETSQNLLREGIVLIGMPIDDSLAYQTIARLLFLDNSLSVGLTARKDVRLYIDVEESSVSGTLAIYQTMRSMKVPVATYTLTGTKGISTLLLASGAKGKRYAHDGITKQISLRRPRPAFLSSDEEVFRQKLEIAEMESIELLAKHTEQPLSKIERDVHSSLNLTPEEAVEYGIIDYILPTSPTDRKDFRTSH